MLWIRNDLLRIRLQIYYLGIFGNYKKNLHLIKRQNLPTICHFLFPTILYSPTVHRPEFIGLKLNFFVFICSFIFAGSGSETIIPDPDPGKNSALWECDLLTYLNAKIKSPDQTGSRCGCLIQNPDPALFKNILNFQPNKFKMLNFQIAVTENYIYQE